MEIEAPSREEWEGRGYAYRAGGVTHVVEGPWRVVIRGLGAHAERALLGGWEIDRSWSVHGGRELRAGPGRVVLRAGASEQVVAGASERRWGSGSEVRMKGASERFRTGASEVSFRGASERLLAGASQALLRGASERHLAGGSESRLGGSELRMEGGSASPLGYPAIERASSGREG